MRVPRGACGVCVWRRKVDRRRVSVEQLPQLRPAQCVGRQHRVPMGAARFGRGRGKRAAVVAKCPLPSAAGLCGGGGAEAADGPTAAGQAAGLLMLLLFLRSMARNSCRYTAGSPISMATARRPSSNSKPPIMPDPSWSMLSSSWSLATPRSCSSLRSQSSRRRCSAATLCRVVPGCLAVSARYSVRCRVTARLSRASSAAASPPRPFREAAAPPIDTRERARVPGFSSTGAPKVTRVRGREAVASSDITTARASRVASWHAERE